MEGKFNGTALEVADLLKEMKQNKDMYIRQINDAIYELRYYNEQRKKCCSKKEAVEYRNLIVTYRKFLPELKKAIDYLEIELNKITLDIQFDINKCNIKINDKSFNKKGHREVWSIPFPYYHINKISKGEYVN